MLNAVFIGLLLLAIVPATWGQGALLPNSNPYFNPGQDITVLEDSGTYRAIWATNISDGEPVPGSQSLSFDLTVNSGNSLFSSAPQMNSAGLLTFRPAYNQYGSAQITATLNDDGTSSCIVSTQHPVCPGGCVPTDCSTSTSVIFTITILAVNDCPSFSHQGDQTSAEDAGVVTVESWARSVSNGASNENDQKLIWSVNNDNNALFEIQPTIDYTSGSSSADLRYKATANAHGKATLTIKLDDDGGQANGGCDTSAARVVTTISITITPVNDAPFFSMGPTPIQIDEDEGQYQASSWAKQISVGANGEDSQSLSFKLEFAVASHSAIFKQAPEIDSGGTLKFETQPDKNTFGLNVLLYVQLNDDGGGSSSSCTPITACPTLEIIINPVNDPPRFNPGNDVNVWEDMLNLDVAPTPASFSMAAWTSGISPGSTEEASDEGQTVSFTVTNTKPSVFAVQPIVDSRGTLTFTLNPNANGAVPVTVSITDSKGLTGNVQTFRINVMPSNDAPVFSLSSTTVTVLEDATSQSVSGFVSSIAKGPPTATDEATQYLTFSVSTANADMFEVQPAVSFTSDESAKLTFKTAANRFGDATVSITLRDDGGTSNKGVDSTTKTFTISVAASNDAPSFTLVATEITIVEDQFSVQEYTAPNFVQNVEPGPHEGSDQEVSFTTSYTNAAIFSLAPRVASNGLTFRTTPDAVGEATITVIATDNHDPPLTVERTVALRILARNDKPIFTIGKDLTGSTLSECRGETACPYSFGSWATDIAAGPSNEASQSLSFNVMASAHAKFFVSLPTVSTTTGTLSFSLRPNQNTASSGPLTFTVTLTDNGGTLNQGVDVATDNFKFEIPAFIDAPSATVNPAVVESSENAGKVTREQFLTAVSSGSVSTNGENLRFLLTAADAELFDAQPAVAMDSATSATLSYTSSQHVSGTTTVSMIIENLVTSKRVTMQFTISILAVNSAPTFSMVGDVQVLQGSGAYSATQVQNPNAGPHETSQTYTFSIMCEVTSFFKTIPSIDASGVLRFELTETGSGTTLCTVLMRDDGGTTRGGTDTSAPQAFYIRVGPLNHPPSFRGGGDVTILEDAGITYRAKWATELSVGFGDSSAEQKLFFVVDCTQPELFVTKPTISGTDGTLIISPAQDAYGRSACTVVLTDSGPGIAPDKNISAAQTFNIVIVEVNDAPTFTGAGNVVVYEDSETYDTVWATKISSGPANEAAQEVAFSVSLTDPMLFSTQPTVSASGSLFFTVAPHQWGTSSAAICLKDDGGTLLDGADSACETILIAVVAVNDAPNFRLTNYSITLFEDAGTVRIPRLITELSAGPVNEHKQSITSVTVQGASGSTAACNAMLVGQPSATLPTGDVQLTLVDDVFGDCVLNITVVDSEGASTSAAFALHVVAVNDPPIVSVGDDIAVDEGSGLHTVPNWAVLSVGGANEQNQRLSVSVTAAVPTMFDVQPSIEPTSGNLTFKLGQHVIGTAHFTIVVSDSGGSSNGGSSQAAPVTSSIIVRPVNNQPSFTLPQGEVTVLEDSGAISLHGFATSIHPGGVGEDDQVLQFSAVAATQHLFATPPSVTSNGTLSFTAAENAFGNSTVALTLRDSGGTTSGGQDTSSTAFFTIIVVPVNDPPSFVTIHADVSLFEDEVLVVSDWAQGISAGPGEDDQTMRFDVIAPAVEGGATLGAQLSTVKANTTHLVLQGASNFNGDVHLMIVLHDDGGVANGGVDQVAGAIRVHVLPVNDAPIFNLKGAVTVDQDSNTTTILGWASGVVAGPNDENKQRLTYFLTVSDPTLFSILPTIADLSVGDLRFKVAAGRFGSVAVSLTVRDDAGTSNGGNNSFTASTTITVRRINQAPSFTPAFESLSVSVKSSVSKSYALNIADDLPDALVAFRVTRNTNPALFTTEPAVTPSGVLKFTASSITGTTTLFVSAVDGEEALSTPQPITVTVVAAEMVKISLNTDIETFNVQSFRQAIAELFEVHIDRVVVTAFTAASVNVEFFISGEQPPVPPALFQQRSENKGDPMYSQLPILSVDVTTNAPTPSPPDGSPPSPTPTPPDPTNSTDPDTPSTGDSSETLYVYILIAVVVLLVVLLISIVCVVLYRRKQKKEASSKGKREAYDASPEHGEGAHSMYANPPGKLPAQRQQHGMYQRPPTAHVHSSQAQPQWDVTDFEDYPNSYEEDFRADPFQHPPTMHRKPSWVRPQDAYFSRQHSNTSNPVAKANELHVV